MSTGLVHLHARYGPVDDTVCRVVCGLPCDTVTTAYRDRDGIAGVTCTGCIAGLPADRPVTAPNHGRP